MPVQLQPVLLLALLGAVADELAPGTPQQSAPIRWLWPIIDPTVYTEIFEVFPRFSHPEGEGVISCRSESSK